MSLEQNPNDQKPEGSAVEIEGSEKFDAKGNLRTMHQFLDGRMALLSEEEYKEELEASKED